MFRLFRNILNSQEKIILGRWNYTKSITELDRKIYLANYDHCGPCGNLYYNKNKRLPKHLTMKLEDIILEPDKKSIHRMIKK